MRSPKPALGHRRESDSLTCAMADKVRGKKCTIKARDRANFQARSAPTKGRNTQERANPKERGDEEWAKHKPSISKADNRSPITPPSTTKEAGGMPDQASSAILMPIQIRTKRNMDRIIRPPRGWLADKEYSTMRSNTPAPATKAGCKSHNPGPSAMASPSFSRGSSLRTKAATPFRTTRLPTA